MTTLNPMDYELEYHRQKFEADRLKSFVHHIMPQLTGMDQRTARTMLEHQWHGDETPEELIKSLRSK